MVDSLLLGLNGHPWSSLAAVSDLLIKRGSGQIESRHMWTSLGIKELSPHQSQLSATLFMEQNIRMQNIGL